jgi:2-polyprenyl-3-methyl-5-hydroxy-6-metoxy-1,4-benzoquinol methylase
MGSEAVVPEHGPCPHEGERFDPAFLTDEDVDDLTSFTGMTREAVRERLNSYSLDEMTANWTRANPSAEDELLEFYRSADEYVWELMQWHASADRRPYWDALAYLADNHPAHAGWGRVYDFGCGVGTDALYLAQRGYSVTLVDVEGPAFHLARHRFQRRQLPASFVESHSMLPEPDGTYDVVVCFDVLEHLPKPLDAARRLVACLRPGGLLLQRATFEDADRHPCHLAAGIGRFEGMNWNAQLAGLGLKSLAPLVYGKVSGLEALLQKLRFVSWRLTGLWVMRLRR